MALRRGALFYLAERPCGRAAGWGLHGAVVDGAVSVSPLTAPHTTEHHEALDTLAESYDPGA